MATPTAEAPSALPEMPSLALHVSCLFVAALLLLPMTITLCGKSRVAEPRCGNQKTTQSKKSPSEKAAAPLASLRGNSDRCSIDKKTSLGESRREQSMTRSMRSESSDSTPRKPPRKSLKPPPKVVHDVPQKPKPPEAPRLPTPVKESARGESSVKSRKPPPGMVITSNARPGVIFDGDIVMVDVRAAKPKTPAAEKEAPGGDRAVVTAKTKSISLTDSAMEVAHEPAPVRDPHMDRERARQLMDYFCARNERCKLDKKEHLRRFVEEQRRGPTPQLRTDPHESAVMLTDETDANSPRANSVVSAVGGSFPTDLTSLAPDVPGLPKKSERTEGLGSAPTQPSQTRTEQHRTEEERESTSARRHFQIYSPIYVPPEKRQFRPVSEIPADDLTVKREVRKRPPTPKHMDRNC